MASRKDKPTPPEKGQQPSRFTLDDIERAILGVKRAGLVVRSVEITATGSIKIEAGRHKEADASMPEASEQQEEKQPARKRV